MAFWWLVTRANPSMLNEVFTRWIAPIADELPLKSAKRVAIDGKALRGRKKARFTMLSAYDSTRGLLLGQIKTKEKSNEITAIPELLKVIDVKDAVVTIDAMGCQKQIVNAIRERGGHYVIALKGNKGTLHAEAESFFQQARAVDYEETGCSRATTTDKGHSREEKREVTVIEDLDWLACRGEWRGISKR